MTDYVLNRRRKMLHKLPASESCNTDQIVDEIRFSGPDDETPVAYQDRDELITVAYQDHDELISLWQCARCFRG